MVKHHDLLKKLKEGWKREEKGKEKRTNGEKILDETTGGWEENRK